MTTVLSDTVAEARAVAREHLRTALERLDQRTALVCGYHLGLCDATGRPEDGGGKGIRAELVLLTTRTAGGDPLVAVPAAAATELVHNFSLVHDDVMDGDALRRHRPTVWSLFGVSTAILAGDAMLALAAELLAEAPSPNVGYAVRALGATTRRLIAGQAADLAFETRADVSLPECLRMEADKTGALLACACSLGPMLVDAPARVVGALAEFGERTGVAFQLTDDLLGIWGNPERTGKPVLSDLRARKKSAPVVAALVAGTPAAGALARLYHQDDVLSQEQLEEAAALVEAAGGRDWVERRVQHELDRALAVLAEAVPDRDDAAQLRALALQLAGRDS